MHASRTYVLAAAALATALTLSACSSGTAGTNTQATSGPVGTPTASASFATADVTFAQMMIPHHQQAVEMSDDLLAKAGIDQRILDLATQIKTAQEPEIKQLNKWLTAWGTDANSTDGMSGMPGMGDGSDGLMSAEDMTALKNASGAAAGKLFLQQMTVHHQGAIAMAQLELNSGQSTDAKAMAKNIEASQTDQIKVMKEILATL